MKTFTTYAEKKAKQFFNLLQGYTKGIRLTAILILLLMGVSNAWGGDNCDFLDPSKGEDNVYIKYSKDGGNATQQNIARDGQTDINLGTVTSLKITEFRGLTKKHNGNVCSVKMHYGINSSRNGDRNEVKEAGWSNDGYAEWTWDSYWSVQQFKNNNVNLDVLSNLYPGTYYFDFHFTIYGNSGANDGCYDNQKFWNNNGGNYHIKFNYYPDLYIAGDNNWGGFGNWDVNNINGKMTFNGTETYSITFNNVEKSNHEFKITNGTWNNAIGHHTDKISCIEGTVSGNNNGGNITFKPNNEGTVTITYNASTGKIVITCPAPTENKFNVTAVANPTTGGTVTPTTATQMGQDNGGNITATAKTGYTFTNWTIKSGSGYFGTSGTNTTSTTANSKFRPKEVSTVQANFTANTYTITYNDLHGVTHSNPTTYTIESEPITFTNPTSERTGYTFKGWNPTGIAKGSTGNKTVTAQWTIINYTITYNLNGGTNPNNAPTSYNVTTATFNLPTPTKTGYTFEGWYENAEFTGDAVTQIAKGSTGDKTFYAKWTANTYAVIFHANGGKGDMEDQEFTYDMEQALTANAFNRTGYTFAGWNTNANGSGTAYNNGQSVQNLTDDDNGTINLYAQWTEITYTVNISTDGNGTVSPSGDQEIGIEGLEVTATPNNRFQFAGWEVTGGAQVADENSATTTITAKEPGTVTAHFKELELKTIYLKTVEGTTDGVKWYVKYNGTEYLMDELGCTNEYYKGVVPEGTSFQFVSKDNNNATVETKGTDLQYVEGKTLYNLVSLSAGGNKIFFKPNQQWIDKAAKEKLHFAGSFWTDSAVWKEMTDDNSDGIYECEKPANAIQVIFCLVNTTNNIENWGNDWSHTQIQTDGNNAYKLIPNGSNLFTITDNKEGQAIGTWSTHADTPINGDGEWEEFTGITYRITFNQQGATTAGTTHVDVAYHASMPEIEKLPTKTEKKFGGYYTQQNGQGVILVNAFGEWQDANGYISSTTWESEDCITLYAYWKELTPEITDVTLNAEIFEPVDDDKEGIVTAVPTINEHKNTTLTYVVCWKLLYTNGREVEGEQYKATPVEGNKVQFSIAGLSTGTYTIRASLHTGNDCGSGEEISRFDKQFSIVANRIITVNYTCDGNTIMASTKQNAHVIDPTSITAPDIIGYTFKEWVAGDGVIISTADKTKKDIEFTAYYDGYLTATYTKNDNIIYFYNTLGWQNVYVYFYSSDKYWDNNMGSGSKKEKTFTNGDDNDHKPHYREYRGQMTHIAGTQIWYYDCSVHDNEIKGYTNVVFNKHQQDDYEWFSNTEVVRRGDMDADKLPMFVPIKGQNPELKNNNTTKYYNKGYWMNYPENTGYKLQIYDGTGNSAKEVASIRFPYSTNTIMPLTVSVDLEAGKTYGFKILREDNVYFGNDGTITENITNWSFETGKSNCGLQTTLAGDYTFTLKYAAPDQKDPNNYQYCVDVVYPVSVGDYRVVYTDNAQWSQTAAHGAKWYHPSYAIKKNSSATEVKTDIVSFFIAKNNSPAMKFQKCTAINGQAVTWADVENGAIIPPKDKTETSVYNFIVKQPAGGASISVESVEPYTGNYYIRVDAMDGKWGNYKTNPDNRMTYSAFSESEANKFGDKFSHYATKWCEEGTNVKFTIANDYSPCISDTLIQDNGNPFKNIDIHGNLTSNSGKHAANIRFMWNRHTNKISRAYVAGSTFTDRQFLILKANKEIKNGSGGSLSNAGDNHNAHQAIFSDTQNWIYERTIQVQPGTRVKLYACYPEANVANAQYFRGTYDNNNATWNDNNSVQILGGTGESWNTIRVIYDFKTNRLMAAWVPTGEINDVKSLEADMMILREHQEDAACITFADSDDKLVNIKTVYGVLRLNKYILNNKKTTGNHEILDPKDQKSIYERALYFISFPFDVHLSDVFGFGTYGTHWVISEYNGLRRAQNGYFVDNCMNEDCTNWDYIWDPSNFTMKANQGYLLSLDLDLMKDNNESFWAHSINTVELYFPSYEHVQTIQQTDYTMDALGEKYRCTINYSNLPGHTEDSDRRVKDSYWRCIGVPSFADYNSTLTDGTNPITWKPKGNEFPFLYEWNVSDNSLMVCAASQYKFRPTFAYLVQNGNEIHWSAVNATPPPASIAARQRTDVERNYEWKITLSRDDNQEDQTFLRMTDNEEVSEDFDFNQDLVKELNYGRSDIYTLIGYEKAAANSMPFSENTTVVPLGLDIEQDGDYTIAMPEGVGSVGVTLLDAETGERTNLSIGMDYTISLNKGACHNRLYLEISPIQQTPTDIEYTDQGTREQSVRKVLIDGKLYIVCDGVVYDAQGKRL